MAPHMVYWSGDLDTTSGPSDPSSNSIRKKDYEELKRKTLINNAIKAACLQSGIRTPVVHTYLNCHLGFF